MWKPLKIPVPCSQWDEGLLLGAWCLMVQKGSCIKTENFKERLSPPHFSALLLDRSLLHYASILFRPLTLHAKHNPTTAAALLAVAFEKAMFAIFGSSLRCLLLRGIVVYRCLI